MYFRPGNSEGEPRHRYVDTFTIAEYYVFLQGSGVSFTLQLVQIDAKIHSLVTEQRDVMFL